MGTKESIAFQAGYKWGLLGTDATRDFWMGHKNGELCRRGDTVTEPPVTTDAYQAGWSAGYNQVQAGEHAFRKQLLLYYPVPPGTIWITFPGFAPRGWDYD